MSKLAWLFKHFLCVAHQSLYILFISWLLYEVAHRDTGVELSRNFASTDRACFGVDHLEWLLGKFTGVSEV